MLVCVCGQRRTFHGAYLSRCAMCSCGSAAIAQAAWRLAAVGPAIAVPTITLEGDANAIPHVDGSVYAKKIPGKYAHRVSDGGVRHNLPKEAPQAFAQAVVDVDRFRAKWSNPPTAMSHSARRAGACLNHSFVGDFLHGQDVRSEHDFHIDGRHRPAEVPALGVVTADVLQERPLFDVFHAFGDHSHA